jgi:hypothetical protein
MSFLALMFVLFIYFLPWLNSLSAHHKNSTAILLVNLFFGWTLIGWVGALIWSTTKS